MIEALESWEVQFSTLPVLEQYSSLASSSSFWTRQTPWPMMHRMHFEEVRTLTWYFIPRELPATQSKHAQLRATWKIDTQWNISNEDHTFILWPLKSTPHWSGHCKKTNSVKFCIYVCTSLDVMIVHVTLLWVDHMHMTVSLTAVIEKYTENVRFCMICNYLSKIIPALQSRCTRFRFGPLEPKQMEHRLEHVIKQEK